MEWDTKQIPCATGLLAHTHQNLGVGWRGGGCCWVRRCVWHAADAGSAPQCGMGFFSPGQPSLHSYRDCTTPMYNCMHQQLCYLQNPQHWQPYHCLDTKSQHAVSQPSKMNCRCWSGWQLKMVVCNTYPENECYYFQKKPQKKTPKRSRQTSWHKSTIRNKFQLGGAAVSRTTFSRKSIPRAAQGTKSWMKKISKTKWWVTLHFNVWQCAQVWGNSWENLRVSAEEQRAQVQGNKWDNLRVSAEEC